MSLSEKEQAVIDRLLQWARREESNKAYLTVAPTQQEYHELIHEFFNDSAYMAKNLGRDNLLLSKHCLGEVMKFGRLGYEYLHDTHRRMLAYLEKIRNNPIEAEHSI